MLNGEREAQQGAKEMGTEHLISWKRQQLGTQDVSVEREVTAKSSTGHEGLRLHWMLNAGGPQKNLTSRA